MKINEEQAKRVLELEEEFSDKRLGEIFPEISAREILARRKRLIRRAIFALLICTACVFILGQFFVLSIVNERSADTALYARDCVLIAKKAYVFDEIRVQDVVVLDYNNMYGADRNVFKQVVGLQGDRVEIRDGDVSRFITKEEIGGKVIFRLLPISKIGRIPQ